jgi:hypothetical protein
MHVRSLSVAAALDGTPDGTGFVAVVNVSFNAARQQIPLPLT